MLLYKLNFVCSALFLVCEAASKFPDKFKFGVGTSAYQVEGAWKTDGKGESVWDYTTHNLSETIADRSNGDVACDSYNKIDEEIKNLNFLNVDYYRFSLSWPRILPRGYSDVVNNEGVQYYNRLINRLIANNIEPVVTIFHWDLPQNFQTLGGWTNSIMSDYFADYARVCFRLFGKRVKLWTTINEPGSICRLPPYHSSGTLGPESYLCGHNLLLAHAKAYKIYRTEFEVTQKGKVGISVETSWFEPYTNTDKDIKAAESAMQANFAWFIHPIFAPRGVQGGYPRFMRRTIDATSKNQKFPRSILPYFTKGEIALLTRSADFLGLNHYTTFLVRPSKSGNCLAPHRLLQNAACNDYLWNTTLDATPADEKVRVVPWGLRKLLNWIRTNYNNVEVLITENGYGSLAGENQQDVGRAKYLNSYLDQVLKALGDGCNVKGYIFWSLMDNFEWYQGYTVKYGLFHVDFKSRGRPRKAKLSATEFKNIAKTKTLNPKYIDSTQSVVDFSRG